VDGSAPEVLVTENETNTERLFGTPNRSPWVKDAFHERVVAGRQDATAPGGEGTKVAPHYRLDVPAGGEVVVRLRLTRADVTLRGAFGASFERTFSQRIREADAFYAERIPQPPESEAFRVARQAYAGLLWSKQFYYYDVAEWLEGDPAQPAPPAGRRHGR